MNSIAEQINDKKVLSILKNNPLSIYALSNILSFNTLELKVMLKDIFDICFTKNNFNNNKFKFIIEVNKTYFRNELKTKVSDRFLKVISTLYNQDNTELSNLINNCRNNISLKENIKLNSIKKASDIIKKETCKNEKEIECLVLLDYNIYGLYCDINNYNPLNYSDYSQFIYDQSTNYLNHKCTNERILHKVTNDNKNLKNEDDDLEKMFYNYIRVENYDFNKLINKMDEEFNDKTNKSMNLKKKTENQYISDDMLDDKNLFSDNSNFNSPKATSRKIITRSNNNSSSKKNNKKNNLNRSNNKENLNEDKKKDNNSIKYSEDNIKIIDGIKYIKKLVKKKEFIPAKEGKKFKTIEKEIECEEWIKFDELNNNNCVTNKTKQTKNINNNKGNNVKSKASNQSKLNNFFIKK